MRLPILLGSLTLFGCTLVAVARAAQPPAGFTALFNGKDLTGWRGGDTFDHRQLIELPEAERAAKIAEWTKFFTELKDGKAPWRVEDGILVNDGLGYRGHATTEKDYGDFELLIEFKLTKNTDTGIYLRSVPQVQIWDSTKPDRFDIGYAKGSGGLWNNEKGTPGRDPLVNADNPIGEWNALRVLMVGSRVSVWLNQQLVVDHAVLENIYDKNNKKLKPEERRPIPARGPIQLQPHNGVTYWRNIFIREIGGEEANRLLAKRGSEDFRKIFDGRSLDGWAGAIDSVEIKDGAMVWREKKGGIAFWNQELADFQARLMFKLPKAGNNGLVVRHPGTSNDTYAAMCELQILDDNYEVNKPVKTLDPRHVHGSAYGLVAAARGYQRPLGEWNFQEVTVKGSTIKVELNGTVILDTDLSKVDPATVKKPYPGNNRTSGFFGFAGHSDPVAFKDVWIKRL